MTDKRKSRHATNQLLDFAVVFLRGDFVDVGEPGLGGHLVAMLVGLLLMQILKLLQLFHVGFVSLLGDFELFLQRR